MPATFSPTQIMAGKSMSQWKTMSRRSGTTAPTITSESKTSDDETTSFSIESYLDEPPSVQQRMLYDLSRPSAEKTIKMEKHLHNLENIFDGLDSSST
jgi:hypothetical protein